MQRNCYCYSHGEADSDEVKNVICQEINGIFKRECDGLCVSLNSYNFVLFVFILCIFHYVFIQPTEMIFNSTYTVCSSSSKSLLISRVSGIYWTHWWTSSPLSLLLSAFFAPLRLTRSSLLCWMIHTPLLILSAWAIGSFNFLMLLLLPLS